MFSNRQFGGSELISPIPDTGTPVINSYNNDDIIIIVALESRRSSRP